jgi:hypothetical protein
VVEYVTPLLHFFPTTQTHPMALFRSRCRHA